MPKVSETYKEKRRLELLQKAEKVFIAKGFSSTTMSDIVEASGLSRGGVYHYFSSTDEIFRAIIDEDDRGGKLYFSNLAAKHKSVWEAIEHNLEEYKKALQHAEEDLGIVKIEYFMMGWRDQGRKSYISKRFGLWNEMISGLIQTGVERGEFKPLQPVDTIALFMINVLDGIHLQTLIIGHEQYEAKGQIDSLRFYLKTALQVNE